MTWKYFQIGKKKTNRFCCSSWLNVGTHESLFFKSPVALRRAAGSDMGAIKINTHTQYLPAESLAGREGQVAPGH